MELRTFARQLDHGIEREFRFLFPIKEEKLWNDAES